MQVREISPKLDSANENATPDLSSVLWIMAFTAGAGISNVFYVQSMVDVIGKSLAMSPADLGLVPASTIGGYSLGLFFLVPLGDRFDRKRLILLQLVAVIASLLVMATASNAAILLLGGLAVGISASFTQQIPPFASSLASPATRGRVVGTVVSAIMMGILLARTVSGVTSEFFGWRTVFFAAAVLMALVGILVYWRLPSSRRTTDLPYSKLMGSLWPLVRDHAVLREAMLLQVLIFGAFNAFWATLPTLLEGEPYHLGSGVAGAFGIIGAVGAMAAALAGRLSDKLGPRRVAALSAITVLVSFGVLLSGPMVHRGPDHRRGDDGRRRSRFARLQSDPFLRTQSACAESDQYALYLVDVPRRRLGFGRQHHCMGLGGMDRRDGILRHPFRAGLRRVDAQVASLISGNPCRAGRIKSCARHGCLCAGFVRFLPHIYFSAKASRRILSPRAER